jgi:hypothetical protein
MCCIGLELLPFLSSYLAAYPFTFVLNPFQKERLGDALNNASLGMVDSSLFLESLRFFPRKATSLSAFLDNFT